MRRSAQFAWRILLSLLLLRGKCANKRGKTARGIRGGCTGDIFIEAVHYTLARGEIVSKRLQ